LNQLKAILTNKKARYGTFSTLTAMLVIAVLVFVNVVTAQFNMKFDITQEKLYSISKQTKDVLAQLEEDIYIYPLFVSGAENAIFVEILDQYDAASSRITVIPKDPNKYGAFVAQYQSEDMALSQNSIIVESGKRFRVIPANKLVSTTYNQQTYQQEISSIDIEPRVTNAIQYVTQVSTPTVYELTGHNEMLLSATFTDILDEANFYLQQTELLLSAGVPDDCAALVLSTPERDYNEEETQKIIDYLSKGGRALIIADLEPTPLPNFNSILATYGTRLNGHYVYETDAARVLMGDPRLFLPVMNTEHAIVKDIIAKGYTPIIAFTQGIEVLEQKKNSVKVEAVLSSTKQAFGKYNPESQSPNFEDGDINGPFIVGAAITDSYYIANDTFTTKIFLLGSSALLVDSVNQASYGTNAETFVNAMKWLTDQSEADTVYVPSKTYTAESYLSMTAKQASNTKIVATGVIPGLTIVTGLVIWLRRRNK